jgi:hypothetical protein
LELELGNSRAAREALQRALRIGYQNPQVAYGAMTVYQALGDHDAAVTAAADALEAAPELASDPSWSSSRDREVVFESALDVVLERAEPVISYKIAMEAGRHEEALRLASLNDEDHRAVAGAAVAARFGDEDAFDELHRIAANNPLDSGIVAACRRVATVSHRTDWPYGWTGECTGSGPFESAAVRVTDAVNERATLPGPDATWHNQYVYRRPTPFDELVPGVPHLRSVYGE